MFRYDTRERIERIFNHHRDGATGYRGRYSRGILGGIRRLCDVAKTIFRNETSRSICAAAAPGHGVRRNGTGVIITIIRAVRRRSSRRGLLAVIIASNK